MNIKTLLGSAAIIAYFSDLQKSKPDEYASNEKQYNKFISLINYCRNLETKYDCELYRCVFNPKWIDGAVEMLFHGEFAVDKDDLPEFLQTLELCDGINIASNPLEEDWVQVTFFVNKLWDKK